MLELKHLRSIKAIANSSSLKAAAAKLFITDSALSHQLKDIEQRIGASLVVRKQQPLALTEQGCQLLSLATQVLPLIEKAEQTLLHSHQQQSRLNISVDCHACFQWLLPSLQQFQHTWPQVSSSFCQDKDYNGLPLLQSGEADLLLTSNVKVDQQIHYQALFEYEMVLICPPQHRLSQHQSIQAADLVGETVISYPVALQRLDLHQHILAPANIEPKQWKHADNPAMLLQMVAAGMGVAAMPYWAVEHYAAQQFISLRSFKQALWRPMYAAYSTNLRTSTPLQAFISLILEQAFSQLKGTRTLRAKPQ
ncbi:XRE family transcriptional regulator [Agarivorans sp. Toyoura001]|uniref:LysR substrate-binding domain-containing protein n=1 Tax=Agarivorans sp. Toyoura001 TaxID=2283141 RepID=UPI0010F3F482|nr:LysR substrate-binding domain-containing protein [Agarivorans sp. Toyoura001]GDY27077.1 XRE family transcriptional regulator [Agarivorans sp. Toyoura001]